MYSAYIIHRYPYQDHSVLLKLFTKEQGMVTVIAKGAKKARSPWYGIMQPFVPLLIEYRGRGEVFSLNKAESIGSILQFEQNNLLTAFYLNELLLTFLPPHQDCPYLFEVYQDALSHLSKQLFEGDIRNFELSLLQELGFVPNLLWTEDSEKVQAEQYYHLHPGHLPIKAYENLNKAIKGAVLIDIEARNWASNETLKTAKMLLRTWIHHYSRGKLFKSRELFF